MSPRGGLEQMAANVWPSLPTSAVRGPKILNWTRFAEPDASLPTDYDLKQLVHVWTETDNQDRRIVEENARGIRSPAYEPGPYSEVHEGGTVQFFGMPA